MFDAPPDSPQAVGDIVGRAFRTCRRNLPLIFRVLLVPTIFASAGGLALQWIVSYGVADIFESKDLTAGFALFALGLVTLMVLCLSGWVLTIRQLALVRVLIGFSPDYAAADKLLFKRKWDILGVYFLGAIFFSILIGFWIGEMILSAMIGSGTARGVFASVGAIVGLWGVIVSFSLYLLAGFMALCVLACEDESIMGVIGRSVQLTVRYFWRALGFGLLLMLVFSIITYPLSLPVVALTVFDMFRHGLGTDTLADTYKAPVYVMVVNQLWESLVGIVLRPAIFFAFALFYYDLRVRGEGLDLSRRLEAFKAEAA